MATWRYILKKVSVDTNNIISYDEKCFPEIGDAERRAFKKNIQEKLSRSGENWMCEHVLFHKKAPLGKLETLFYKIGYSVFGKFV